MTAALKNFHASGYIHNDVKPDNILTDLNKSVKKVFLIDFGISKKYINPYTRKHSPLSYNQNFSGNLIFCSKHAMNGFSPSRRYDFESLLYSLIYLYKGSLP